MVKKATKKSIAIIGLLSLEFIIVWILFIGSVLLFALLAEELLDDGHEKFDTAVYYKVRSFSSPFVTELMKFMSFIGSKYIVPVLFLLVLFYSVVIRRHKWYSLKVPVVVIGSLLLNEVLKLLFARPRPVLNQLVKASGLSFPSGHAMTAFAFYGLLIYFIWKESSSKAAKITLTVILLVIIHLIGISRIYLGVHYATDVIAGFAVGYSWLILSILVLRQLEKKYQKEIDPENELET